MTLPFEGGHDPASAAGKLARAWKAETRVTLDTAHGPIVGYVEEVAATGAYAVISGVHVPLDARVKNVVSLGA